MVPMISYAQNCEDVLLRRLFPDRLDGFYIDVGANDPLYDSVTKHFYDRGWHGINVEPNTRPYARLCDQRPRDINLNMGLSDREATLELLECQSNDGLSTFSTVMANIWREQGLEFATRHVPVTTLAAVCETHVDRTVDFLKIDAEAHEREVIEGNNWQRFRPRVVLVEATWPEKWEPLLFAADYHFAAFDGLNRYYVRTEDQDLLPLFTAPVNVCDQYTPYHYQSKIDHLSDELANFQTTLGRKIHELTAELANYKRTFGELTAKHSPEVLELSRTGTARRRSWMASKYSRLSTAVQRVTRRGA